MREIAFAIGKKKVRSFVPESWEELSEGQFLAIVGRTFNLLEEGEFYAKYFGISADMVADMDLYYFYVLNSLLSYTRKPARLQTFIIHQVKLVNSKGTTVMLKAPEASLAGMSFQQFMMIDTFYTWYQQTKERKFLLSMCSCCYLKEDEDFFSLVMDERLDYWEQCSEIELKSILVQWSIIKEWLSNAYQYLFPKGGDADSGTGGKVKVTNTWLEIFDTLVADDLTRIETYKHLHCMDVLRVINHKIQEQKNPRR